MPVPVAGRLLVARESSDGVVLKWYDEEGIAPGAACAVEVATQYSMNPL